MGFGPSLFALQCDDCARELVNMRCLQCSPPEQPIVQQASSSSAERALAKRNSRGFPTFGQLTVVKPTSRDIPTTPRSRASARRFPTVIRRAEFKGVDGRLLNISDGTGAQVALVEDGHHRPFSTYVKKGETFTVLTKFKWECHRWETRDIHYDRDTTETAIFRRFCIHFLHFLDAVEKCHNSNACLCDGLKGSAQEVKILGYKLYDLNESFMIKVKALDNSSHVAIH